MSENSLTITQSVFIPVSQQQAWDFLLNADSMKQWFNADEFVIDVIEGGKIAIKLNFSGHKYHIEGEIGLIKPQSKFSFTWLERDRFGEAWFNNTTVNIELEEQASGTLLTVIHDGFQYLPDMDQQLVYQRYLTYWQASGIMDRMVQLISASL